MYIPLARIVLVLHKGLSPVCKPQVKNFSLIKLITTKPMLRLHFASTGE